MQISKTHILSCDFACRVAFSFREIQKAQLESPILVSVTYLEKKVAPL